ncbi:hypothetical protein LX36DRAFT_144016 [Colletotrichum falcatum]|nr:hypothetical protein LX36DRAFT_144016 [Colletotrichum falcatum]
MPRKGGRGLVEELQEKARAAATCRSSAKTSKGGGQGESWGLDLQVGAAAMWLGPLPEPWVPQTRPRGVPHPRPYMPSSPHAFGRPARDNSCNPGVSYQTQRWARDRHPKCTRLEGPAQCFLMCKGTAHAIDGARQRPAFRSSRDRQNNIYE